MLASVLGEGLGLDPNEAMMMGQMGQMAASQMFGGAGGMMGGGRGIGMSPNVNPLMGNGQNAIFNVMNALTADTTPHNPFDDNNAEI